MQQPITFSQTDQAFMRRALTLAKHGLGHTNPNPMVGCVITNNNTIIGEGWHKAAGLAHAEIEALNNCDTSIHGATLYVTLTPCHHHGRTGPCTHAIVDAGIKRVVIAAYDPNAKTSDSVAWLKDQGIQVDIGCLQQDAEALNPVFNHNMQNNSIYVHAKWAMSLDGKMKTHDLENRQISQPETQLQAHYWRQYCDAILVGVNTIICDNPSLTSRYAESSQHKHPLRILLDPKGKTPLDSLVLSPIHPGKTLIISTKLTSADWQQTIIKQGHEVLLTKTDRDGHIMLEQLFKLLYQRGITSILIEGGEAVRDYCIEHQLIHSCDVAIAPIFTGSKAMPKQQLNLTTCYTYDQDCVLTCLTKGAL